MKNIVNVILIFVTVWMVAKWEYNQLPNEQVHSYTVEYSKKGKKWRKVARTLPVVHSAIFNVRKRDYMYRVVVKLRAGGEKVKKVSNVLVYKWE